MKPSSELLEILFDPSDDDIFDALRDKTPAEQLQMGFMMWEHARAKVMAQLMGEHPTWDRERVEREVAAQFLAGEVSLTMREERTYLRHLLAIP